MGHFDRLKFLYSSRRYIAHVARPFSVLVVGKDGAIQRVLAHEVRKRGGKVALLLDGLLFPWRKAGLGRWPLVIYRKIFRCLDRVGLSCFAPSLVGHSILDLLMVMDESVKSVLVSQGVPGKINVVTLPRFERLLEEFKLEADKQSKPNETLYITSAFKWHGDCVGGQQQLMDLRDLVHWANKDHPLAIRIHPRELVEDYAWLRDHDSIRLSPADTSLAADLARARLVVTARSSAAFEAKLVRRHVVILAKNFPIPPTDAPISSFPIVSSLNELERCLIREQHDESQCLCSVQESAFDLLREQTLK
jgi:hypothetical protein